MDPITMDMIFSQNRMKYSVDGRTERIYFNHLEEMIEIKELRKEGLLSTVNRTPSPNRIIRKHVDQYNSLHANLLLC